MLSHITPSPAYQHLFATGSLSEVGHTFMKVVQKAAEIFSIIAKDLWSVSCRAVSLFFHWIAVGFSYVRQWSMLGWKHSSAFAVKAFWSSIHASHIGLTYLKDFVRIYRTEITFTGIGVVATIILTNLFGLLPDDAARSKTKKAT